jgi:archaellum component FlaC
MHYQVVENAEGKFDVVLDGVVKATKDTREEAEDLVDALKKLGREDV